MTLNPATLFGANVKGEIATGAVADLVLWSGDPLDVTSEAELVLIDGVPAAMVSRALQLRDRYYEAATK